MTSASTTTSHIDEDLHSRQLAVYGRQAMGKLSATKVLVSGVNGLGAEIAKNIILAQLGAVTLHDTAAAQLSDLGAHFYLDERDVASGANRAAACHARLQELNPTVKVHASDAALDETLVWAHDIVVLVGHSRGVASQVSKWARERKPTPARVIWTSVNGLFGFVCNDFGPEFVVNDTNGENPRTAVIASVVQNENETLVSCVDDEFIDFENGDIVRLHEIVGMDGVDQHDFVVKDVQKTSFKIAATTQFSPYKSGGTVVQQKQPKVLEFAPIDAAFSAFKGELLETDFAKFGRARLLMLAYEALEALREELQELPALNDAAAAARIVQLAADINAARPEASRVDGLADSTALLQQLALTSRAVLNPMAAFFGGIAGQEVVKAATGKFHPIHQWLLFESLESAPEFKLESRGSFAAAAPSRYSDQIAVFGNEFQAKLGDLKLFMVGAGALGCEFLKNFALMGIGAGPNGLVTLTDDDSIERSNLSRQFLFRNSDVGKSKSEAAAAAAFKMNSALKLKPMQDRVSPNTENVFNDNFWNGLSIVTNALDNVQARLYVDRRCVFFNKPLLESGTLGTKCNTQVVIPFLTENYGASRDPEEKMTPDCTLHNFPHNIQHCLSYSRSEFIGQFTDRPQVAADYANSASADAFLAQLRAAGAAGGEIAMTVEGLKGLIGTLPSSFADCVAWARLVYEEYFVRKIRQLTHLYPIDAVTKSGLPFWSPPKRFPEAEEFSADDELHLLFIQAAASLRAVVSGLDVPDAERRNLTHVKHLVEKVVLPAWAPSSTATIKLDEKNGGEPASAAPPVDTTDEAQLLATLHALPPSSALATRAFVPQEFEKDDPTNFHMDFIHAGANLRARNYKIKGVDALQSKLIAGRIIPAIATTTASATGLVCLELYKQVQAKPLEAYRNAFVNLALPVFQLIEPMPPAKLKSRTERRRPDPINHPEYVEEEEIVAYPDPHTVWDHLVVNEGDLTVQEFIDYFEKKHGWTVNSIALPIVVEKKETAAMVYNSFTPSTKARLPLKFSAVYEKMAKTPIGDRTYFVPSCLFEDDDGKTVETPEIVYRFR